MQNTTKPATQLQKDPNIQDFRVLFTNECVRNQIQIPDDSSMKRFEAFANHLLEVNQQMNLTAIRTVSGVISKHFVDCLLALSDIRGEKKILDIGCGAGFPSIPFAIAAPDVSIVALDSTDKKAQFVAETAKTLGLSNLTAISGRAEEKNVRSSLGKFDVVTSRAVARLSILCELALPYLKIGGKLVALKGAKGGEELIEAENAIKVLGGKSEIRQTKLQLPDGTGEGRSIVTVWKISETPPQYPRKYAEIAKKPL